MSKTIEELEEEIGKEETERAKHETSFNLLKEKYKAKDM